MIICLIAFIYASILENNYAIKEQKMMNDLEKYSSQIDSCLFEFRKNPKIDSLYKLQTTFYTNYLEAFDIDSSDNRNYFFWKNLRKSIKDSTFNFSYANDEIMSEIQAGNNEHTSKLKEILLVQKLRRLNTYLGDLADIKFEFKYFALNNNYERYLSSDDWKKYEEIRWQERKIENDIDEKINYFDYKDYYVLYSFTFCLSVLFILRYLFYFVTWCFKILKQN